METTPHVLTRDGQVITYFGLGQPTYFVTSVKPNDAIKHGLALIRAGEKLIAEDHAEQRAQSIAAKAMRLVAEFAAPMAVAAE
jgi:hypothetical protein